MDFQMEYYEIEEFWNCVPDESDIERIKRVSKLIPPDVTSILDVGCGNGIFVNYLIEQPRKYLRVHAVDRSLNALRFVETEKSRASIENLPFNTGEFDLVVCLEVLEHLSQPGFQQGLIELSRVSSKYIIVAVPNKQNLELGQISCPSCFTKFNPDLHLRSFGIENLKELFIKYNFSCEKIEAICRVEEYVLISNYLQWKTKYKRLGNSAPFNLICPVCGDIIPGHKNLSKTTNKNFKTFVKKVWPKTYRKRWIVALYKKD